MTSMQCNGPDGPLAFGWLSFLRANRTEIAICRLDANGRAKCHIPAETELVRTETKKGVWVYEAPAAMLVAAEDKR